MQQQQFTNDWFGPHKGIWSQLLTRHKPQRILEVGSFEGASVCFCIQTLAPLVPGLELHCVDTWEGGIEHQQGAWLPTNMTDVFERFKLNTRIEAERAACGVQLVSHRQQSSLALARLLAEGKAGYFDFIYIDGSHQAPDVLADAVLAFQLVRVGGLIVFDDYLWNEPGVADPIRAPKLAIDAFVNIFCQKLKVLSAPLYQLYVSKTAD